jgi:hypothetical protein
MFKARLQNAEQYNEMKIVNKALESVTKLKYSEKTARIPIYCLKRQAGAYCILRTVNICSLLRTLGLLRCLGFEVLTAVVMKSREEFCLLGHNAV